MASTALTRIGSTALVRAGLVPTLLSGGFFIAIAGAAYLLIKKIMQRINRNSAVVDIGKNTVDGYAASFATQFYNAMFTSAEWLSDFFGDGTNEDVIFKTAAQMKQYNIAFSDVSRQYRNLYNRDLLSDLQLDLSAEEYSRFQQVLTTGIGALPPVLDKKLQTVRDGMVLNEKFEPVQPVRARTNLGYHLETYIMPNGKIYHGFSYKGNMRYVESTISTFSR